MMRISMMRAGAWRRVVVGLRRSTEGVHRRVATGLHRRFALLRRTAEAGMATAEYAIATLAAVAFAGLLLVILRSDEVRGLLLGIIRQALSVGG
ncbi:DUF4244 domain-containing protein [Occultella glacieicola]|uniref:DUF4244 domain-containing protein n=1 Tax=Occultella glacieicola TaxID=2518684 RepID=A0ABY2DYK1_9MICO|nr:DUF4244 domain-containing protein [Occultella glacieicola]TDE89253.1 DUF4244 domain-containing protein [Occultella glacieicola]